MSKMPRISKIKTIRTIKHKPIRKSAPKPQASGSHIETHEYDEKSQTLTVAFRGGRKYRYNAVDAQTAQGLANASSKGSFMRASVIGKFDATKI